MKNKIVEVVIVPIFNNKHAVYFKDALDKKHNLQGKRLSPDRAGLEAIRRVAKSMSADIDFASGVITLTRREEPKWIDWSGSIPDMEDYRPKGLKIKDIVEVELRCGLREAGYADAFSWEEMNDERLTVVKYRLVEKAT